MRSRTNFGIIGTTQLPSTGAVYSAGDQFSLALQGKWPRSFNVEVLIVGGGGGGCQRHRGGGGAGGVIYNSASVVNGGVINQTTYTVIVGAGGVGSTANSTTSPNYGTFGNDSSFNGQVAVGGGTHWIEHTGYTYNIFNPAGTPLGGTVGTLSSGGSGAGGVATAASIFDYYSAGNPILNQGYPGGYGGINAASEGYYVGGGGGGAGAQGGNAISGSAATPGAGGTGIANPIAGSTIGQLVSSTYYIAGGGGGGGNATSSKTSAAGQGGGAAGGASGAGGSGTANTGGGGGCGGFSGSNNYAGGAGGSGVVVLRYPILFGLASSTTGSPTLTTVGNYYLYTFTSSGTITF